MKKFFAVGLGAIFSLNNSLAAVYNGNGNTSFGGTVGDGSLTLTDDGTTVSGTFTRGTGHDFTDNLVIFIDSKANGFSTTAEFTDFATRQTRAISGRDDGGNSQGTTDFAEGFL